MKVKTISRNASDMTRQTKDDLNQVHRNYNPEMHPFERAREYTRALNATKLDKLFAKPFVAALDGHSDGIYSLAMNPRSLVAFISGACDGEVRMWDLAHRKTVWSAYAHAGIVTGLTVAPDGDSFFSCGEDKTIKQWALQIGTEDADEDPEPLSVYQTTSALNGIDHHWKDPLFATVGEELEIWAHERSEPIHKYAWGADSILSVKFNPAEPCLVATTGSDRSIGLYDVRTEEPLRKVMLQMRSNQLAWNPMEPFNFTVANEDQNLYSFDMRKLDQATMIHKDFLNAVMDVSYSPTGREFVAGSYDKTVRIFNSRSGKSREVYHTKRMQRVFCCRFTQDSKFVISGSDETNVRIWKAQASKTLGKMVPREQRKINYLDKLKERYKNVDEIRKIAKHRHLPRTLMKKKKTEQIVEDSRKRKLDNVKKHSKDGTELLGMMPGRKKAVIKQLE
jgi:WD repeat and SOF domain-containing protein 1